MSIADLLAAANRSSRRERSQSQPQAAHPHPYPHPHSRAGRPTRPANLWQPKTPPAPAPLPAEWDERLTRLDFAFQPIVNIHTGFCFGYEALLRDHAKAGFPSIEAVFDAAQRDGLLARVEAAIRERIYAKFATVTQFQKMKLFLNLDNRAIGQFDTQADAERVPLARWGISETAIAFEISERHPLPHQAVAETAAHLRRHSFKLALDDYGTGYSSMQMLYAAEPDFLKIDRFFITDIDSDARKRVLLQHVISVAHLLGITVIAEGVETEREYFICKSVGADLVQGYLVQRPTTETAELHPCYPHIEALAKAERRAKSSDQRFITEQIELLEPLPVDTPMLQVFQHFRSNKDRTFLPVVDNVGEPLGVVRERDLKNYTYSTYGKDLIVNKAFGYTLKQFLFKCPIADIHMPAEKLLESFSTAGETEGIIIVENMKYAGFLSAHSLLRVINEKNIAVARDQNPLTKLPGNNIIQQHLTETLAEPEVLHTYVYFDFDNFKPFNDTYGFRQGDRAILLFADILRKELAPQGCFLGHIGGDDFFASFKEMDFAVVENAVRGCIARFTHEVASFYDEETRGRGHIAARDREGTMKRFPLLSASAALVEAPPRRNVLSPEAISGLIADLKTDSKASPTKTCGVSLVDAEG